MIPAERRQIMLDFITRNGIATISELSNEFDVSEMTVHRDLHYLEATGYVQKTHGGVIVSSYKVETDYRRRLRANPESKQKIGKAAAALINNGDSILMDASTTTLAMIPNLRNLQNLTIFTTSVSAIAQLASLTKFEVYSTGGLVYEGTDCLVGPSAIEFIKNIHVDKCFMGVAGICAPHGITDPISLIVELKQHMASAANELIVVVDHTKFGRISRFKILPFEEIDLVVTDGDRDTPCVAEIEALGDNILFVD